VGFRRCRHTRSEGVFHSLYDRIEEAAFGNRIRDGENVHQRTPAGEHDKAMEGELESAKQAADQAQAAAAKLETTTAQLDELHTKLDQLPPRLSASKVSFSKLGRSNPRAGMRGLSRKPCQAATGAG
jgi:hypothetical protein